MSLTNLLCRDEPFGRLHLFEYKDVFTWNLRTRITGRHQCLIGDSPDKDEGGLLVGSPIKNQSSGSHLVIFSASRLSLPPHEVVIAVLKITRAIRLSSEDKARHDFFHTHSCATLRLVSVTVALLDRKGFHELHVDSVWNLDAVLEDNFLNLDLIVSGLPRAPAALRFERRGGRRDTGGTHGLHLHGSCFSSLEWRHLRARPLVVTRALAVSAHHRFRFLRVFFDTPSYGRDL